MNTRIQYLYRDASNYKTYQDVIVSGCIEHDQIRPYLRDKILFIPSAIGLDDLQQHPLSNDDHIWHEIIEIQSTDENPTIEITANDIMSKFVIAHANNWNEYSVFERKGLI